MIVRLGKAVANAGGVDVAAIVSCAEVDRARRGRQTRTGEGVSGPIETRGAGVAADAPLSDAEALELHRLAVARAAARDWLDTQSRVIEYWRDLLIEAGETSELIEALDAHAAFLSRASQAP